MELINVELTEKEFEIIKTLRKDFKEIESELVNGNEHLLGKGIIIPNNPANSGSRKLLQSTQAEQILPIYDSEAPIYQTGYGLDKLVSDPNEIVRTEARKHCGMNNTR